MADPWQTLSSNMFSLPGVMSAASEHRKSRLQEMMLGKQMAQEEKTSAAREKATSMYRSGDRKGARDEAITGGAYDLAEALGKMDTAEQEQVKQRLSLVGEAALWADTPEKWDQSIDYLVEAGHPDLAQYRGKFSPAARQAAIAAAGQSKEFFERNKPVLMGPGYEMRNPSDGSLIAKTPFAPWRQTLSPGQTLVGGQETGEQGLPPDDIFARMLHTESRGRQFGANGQPLTSPAGAIGIAQVMPGTAPEAARLAGLPFDDNRYRNDPEYNQALGRAYFEKQLADFGDPEKAVAAYNAGPGGVQRAVQKGGENWKSYLPAETKGYLQSVFGAAPAGGPRVLATGAPKEPEWSEIPPQESARYGPGVWLRNKNGDVKPAAGGRDGNPRKAEADLRKEFNNHDDVKTFRTQHAAMSKLASLGKRVRTATPQDDIALIFSYMKIQDPGSVVREGEYATAANAASVPDNIRNIYNKAIDGNRLNSTQRSNMILTAKRMYDPALERFNAVANEYRGYATDYGVNPDRIARRMVYGQRGNTTAAKNAPAQGRVIDFKDLP